MNVQKLNRISERLLGKRLHQSVKGPLRTLLHSMVGGHLVSPPKVVFFHIPKCGGSSLAESLSQCVASEKIFHIKPFPTRQFGRIIWQDFENQNIDKSEALYQYYMFKFREYVLLYSLACRYDFITGHILFSEHAYTNFKKDGYQFITMVRNPVTRFISQYKYSSYDKCDFDEYVELEEVKQQGRLLVQYFSGDPDKHEWAGDVQLAQALKNIEKFDLIAVLEHLDVFQQQFREKYRLNITIPHLNRNTRPSFDLTDEQKTKIAALCEPDMIVYQEILTRMNISTP